MKKALALILITVTIFTITACGNGQDNGTQSTASDPVSPANTETTETGDLSELDALGDVEVDENLFSVEMTIPAEYIGDTTQEELDESAAEHGYKVTLNEDGSATYRMTKSQHEEMLADMAKTINSSLEELVDSEDYPNFTSITANFNFTEFTVTTTSTELNLAESFSVMVFYMYGGMYNIFSGDEVDNIHVDFVNVDSGEVISSADSSDMVDTE